MNNQSLIDPSLRLNLLNEYMQVFIDEWPYKYSFGEYIRRYYMHIVPNTPDYFKAKATHCFYCDEKLNQSEKNHGHIRRSTIDHYHPKSKGRTDKYVICCADCNCRKDNMAPEVLSSLMIKASLKGRNYWGYSGARLQQISGQFQKIASDILFNTGPRIYYVIKHKNK